MKLHIKYIVKRLLLLLAVTFTNIGTNLSAQDFKIIAISPSTVTLSKAGEAKYVLFDCGSGFGYCTLPAGVTLSGPNCLTAVGLGPYIRVTLSSKPSYFGSYYVYVMYNQTVIYAIPVSITGYAIVSDDQNYIMKSTILREGITDYSYLENLASVDIAERSMDISYIDGLGRMSQQVSCQASPTQKDIVQPIVYDAYGRQAQKYLPYASSRNSGTFMPNANAISEQKAYYSTVNGSTDGQLAYAATVFENSPLNRVTEQGAPGANWQPYDATVSGSGHTVKMEYGSNIANDVYLMRVDDATGNLVLGNTISGTFCKYYLANELYKTVTKDENWQSTQTYPQLHTMEEYKDMLGNVVLKRTFVEKTGGFDNVETYYVYDNFGLLRFVIPPLAKQQIDGLAPAGENTEVVTSDKSISAYDGKSYIIRPGASLTLAAGFSFSATSDATFSVVPDINLTSGSIIDNLGYEYTYDKRKRMITKKLPGADPVYMVYDKRDRLVLTQDGEQRKNSQWLFTKYDELNRPVLTGVYTNTTTVGPTNMQALIDQFYASNTNFSETTGTDILGYTNQSFPVISGEDNYLTATYYDAYGTWAIPFTDASGMNISGYSDTQGDTRYFDQVKGIPTGSKVKVLGTSTWLTTTNYYDDKYRVIQTSRNLYNGSNSGIETVSTGYDFVGKVKKARQTQNFNGNVYSLGKRFEYDHTGRLTLIKQLVGSNPNDSVVISQLAYNELGQLQQKTLGTVQNMNYQYNIRGWLTQINDPDNLGSNMFGMKLCYNDVNTNLGNQTQFNGNISGMLWKSSTKAEQGYAFGYDPLNRLTGSDYKVNSAGTWTESTAFEEKSIGYDANGNITALLRTNDTGGQKDNFTYHYNGNQLTDINGGTAYTYDLNGNMKKDGLRNFDVTYNILNLPSSISKGNDNISYIYSASGEKLAKRMKDGKYQYYAGSFVYHDDKSLDYLLFEEGKVNRQANGSFVYDYSIKDHLGNTRVTFSQGGTNIRETEYYPFGSNYSTSSRDNKYLYNDKELQDDVLGTTALDWYDYGARFYDPQIGRWTSLDPSAEKNRRWSPYRYAYDNPLRFADPDGMTEEERLKAVTRMLQHKNSGTTYLSGSGDASVKPGGQSDCVGTVLNSIMYAGYKDLRLHSIPGNGVTKMAHNMQKIDSYNNVEKGYAVITHNFHHIGLVTNVQKDENGNVTSFTMTHNEGGKGAQKVVSTEIYIENIGSDAGEKSDFGGRVNTYEENIEGIYKWDDLPENETTSDKNSDNDDKEESGGDIVLKSKKQLSEDIKVSNERKLIEAALAKRISNTKNGMSACHNSE